MTTSVSSDTDKDFNYWEHFLDGAKRAKFLAVDTEGDGLDLRDSASGATTMGVSMAYRTPNGGINTEYFAFNHKIGKNQPEYFDGVKDVIDNAKNMIFHHVRHDILALDVLGMPIDFTKSRVYCTMSMSHWVNENRMAYGLDPLVRAILGRETGKNMSRVMEKIIKIFGWGNVSVDQMRPYSANDTAITLELFEAIYPEFVAQGFDDKLWSDEIDFLRTLNKMETTGVLVDTELCASEKAFGERRMAEIVQTLGGRRPSSSKDLEDIFFRELKLPIVKRTDGGKPSFDKDAMAEYDLMLRGLNNPVAKQVVEFRGWQKVVTTNYGAYINLLGADGRLHPNYNVHRAKTSRLTCGTDSDGTVEVKSANLQNIPRESKKRWDGNLKKSFIAAPGYRLWEADYSNAELRVTACYSKDPELLRIFKEGRKIFDEMAKALNRPKVIIKGFVYSTSYGAQDKKVSQILGISEHDAQMLRFDFIKTYPGIFAYKKEAANKAQKKLWIKYWTGRRRHFRDWKEAKHLAYNSLMQGGVAELVKNRMIALWKVIDWDECKMLLQVHDSLVFEIKIGTEEKWLPIIKQVMEDVPVILSGKVPFPVEIKEWATA